MECRFDPNRVLMGTRLQDWRIAVDGRAPQFGLALRVEAAEEFAAGLAGNRCFEPVEVQNQVAGVLAGGGKEPGGARIVGRGVAGGGGVHALH